MPPSPAALGTIELPPTILTSAHIAPAPDTDATLLDLIARRAEAVASLEAACRELEAARDRAGANHPPRPTTLTATLADVMLHGLSPSGCFHEPDGRAWVYFKLDDLDRLRTMGPVTSDVLDQDGQSVIAVPNTAGEARRREIVDTYDRWLAERADVDRRHGLTAVEAVEEPLFTTMEAAAAAAARAC